MIDDIVRAALRYIQRFGDKAPLEVTRLAYEAADHGNRGAYSRWIAVVVKIHELQPKRRVRGERLH